MNTIVVQNLGIVNYIRIARLDHAFKNIFVIPGILVAYLFKSPQIGDVGPILLALLATTLAASANYTINEWLDRERDARHPTKSRRPAASGLVTLRGVLLSYSLLCAAAVLVALLVNWSVAATIIIFLIAGIVYNVEPMRTKDVRYLDVVTESVNNVLRLLIGWFSVMDALVLPPSSVMISYWFAGAFLMTVKRVADIQTVPPEKLRAYRPSIANARLGTLQILANFYALGSICLLTVFMVKYRIEFLIPIFGVILLFAIYQTVTGGKDGLAQRPEHLYKSKSLVFATVFLAVSIVLAIWVDLPILNSLLSPLTFGRNG